MYTIIGTVTARPETREELASLLMALVAPTRAEAGCINYDFHVDAADPCVFVFYENWTGRAALDTVRVLLDVLEEITMQVSTIDM